MDRETVMNQEAAMDRETMERCFNEWMRRYTEDPAAFDAEFQTVYQFLEELEVGVEPSYGQQAAAFMRKLAAETA